MINPDELRACVESSFEDFRVWCKSHWSAQDPHIIDFQVFCMWLKEAQEAQNG